MYITLSSYKHLREENGLKLNCVCVGGGGLQYLKNKFVPTNFESYCRNQNYINMIINTSMVKIKCLTFSLRCTDYLLYFLIC